MKLLKLSPSLNNVNEEHCCVVIGLLEFHACYEEIKKINNLYHEIALVIDTEKLFRFCFPNLIIES